SGCRASHRPGPCRLWPAGWLAGWNRPCRRPCQRCQPCWTCSQPSHVLTAWPGDPDLLVAVAPVTGPRGLLGLRVDHGHVAHVDIRLLVHDAAFLGATATLVIDLGVLLDHADALDDHALLVGVGDPHRALAALVLARDDDDVVALLDLHGLGLPRHHSTSGA